MLNLQQAMSMQSEQLLADKLINIISYVLSLKIRTLKYPMNSSIYAFCLDFMIKGRLIRFRVAII